MLQDNQSSSPGLCHTAAGLGDLVQGCGLHLLVAASQEDTGDEVVARRGQVSASDMQQKAADLRLENDNQGDDTHSQNLSQNGRKQLHVQRLHHNPRKVHQEDAGEDVEHGRTAHYPHHLVDKDTYQNDVDNVDY